jgi:FKBP-type peptidyl-prolyl cis-trans isomerase 2
MAPTLSNTATIVLVIIVLIGGGIASAAFWYHDRPSSGSSPLVIALGDNVTVNYVGILGSGPQQGKVFDTSLYSVAYDNIAYPKGLQFTPRGPSPSNFTPLHVFVGEGAPSGGYTLNGESYVQVVTGFWEGLLGLAGNQTSTITIPPALGYGPVDQACVATKTLTYTLPVVETLTGVAFQKAYPGITSTTGAMFSDPHYGWPVVILSANATFVTVENLVHPGYTSSPAGWPVVVTNVTSTSNGTGNITLVNELYPSQAGQIEGKDFLGNGPCTSNTGGKFIVSSVDPAAGTYTENFNQEVQGETLIFIVAVQDIYP